VSLKGNKILGKSTHGGKRANQFGPPRGRKLKAVTRERIRTTIDTANVIKHLNSFMQGGDHQPSQVTAAKILLDRVMPTLAATDVTSGGEPINYVFEKVD